MATNLSPEKSCGNEKKPDVQRLLKKQYQTDPLRTVGRCHMPKLVRDLLSS